MQREVGRLSRDHIVEVPRDSLRNHPAVEAWGRLAPDQGEPRRVFVLKPEKKRSAVYRLQGIGPGPSSVIAKRGRTGRVAIELLVYRQVLPCLSVATLRCYGSVDDQEPGLAWLFLEDAGDEPYAAADSEHRVLAARWLAALHATTALHSSSLSACLPGRGIDYYRKIVSLARETIHEGITNPACSDADVGTLDALMCSCDILESRWSKVDAICRDVPDTLVHGDFGAKNVRIRPGRDGLELLPLDWDSAGWGIPAIDVSQADGAAYWSAVRDYRPELEPDALAPFSAIGRMFLALESITGEADPLRGDWVDNVMRKMRYYESEMAKAFQIAGWAP